MQDNQVLVRMFFENGTVETRPLSWIVFSSADQFEEGDAESLKKLEQRIQGDSEVYVVFIEKLIGMQLFRGRFTNVRAERRHERDSRHRR